MWVEFISKSVKRFIQYFCFPDRSIKGGDNLDFKKGGNLRKGGGMTPPPPDRSIKAGDTLDFKKGGNLRKGGGMTLPTMHSLICTSRFQELESVDGALKRIISF